MGGESPTKKMVERVKEIVHDFSDEEIHAMLEECDMDPNEAVQRLLVKDTFHEVKSKRERKKEVKETQELKFRGGGNISNWEANSDIDAVNLSNGYKKETASVASSLSRLSYAYPPTAKAISQMSGHMSASVNGENREPTRAVNVLNSSMQSTTESKSAGLPKGGRKTSTADNVKVSPRWAEARSYLQDVMQRPERYDFGHSKTVSGCGGASGCSHDSSEQISLHSQIRCHQSLQDSDAAVRAMSTSSESDHTSSEASDKVEEGVLLPNHVQALAAECLNLTFGTYKTHSSSTNSGQRKSDPFAEADGLSMQQLYLPEHLLNDILEPANNFSGGNQDELSVREAKKQQNMSTPFRYETQRNKSDSISQYIQCTSNLLNALPSQEVPSYSSDLLRHLKYGSSMESSPQFLRHQDIFNSTYPVDESRYNTAVSYMKSQTISIPEKILGDDHHEAIKLPEQLFGLPSQHNHTVDGPGYWGGHPNTLQNYGHKPSVEHLLQYLAATTNGHRLPHPLTSLSPSSIDASGFGSTTNNRGSCLLDASVAFNAPPGFQTQFKDLNPFPGQIGRNTALDYGVRPGAIPNAQEQLAYESSFEAQHKYQYFGNNDLLTAFDLNNW